MKGQHPPNRNFGGSEMSPRVSVVMPVYGDLRFIDIAVRSIIAQTFQDFELIMVDDGTGLKDLFARIAAQDERIRVVAHAINKGVTAAINCGIQKAGGDLVAHLDCDDVAKPNWIETLVKVLDADPELGLVGANYRTIDEAGAPKTLRMMPESDSDIRFAMLFCNPFCHSTVCFRRTCYDSAGGYDENWRATGDYEFWFRMLSYCRVANVQQELTEYRVNPRGITATYAGTWHERNDPLRARYWTLMGVRYHPAIADALSAFVLGYDIEDIGLRVPAYRVCLLLLRRFLNTPRRFARSEDSSLLKRLVDRLVGRILADAAVSGTAVAKEAADLRRAPFRISTGS